MQAQNKTYGVSPPSFLFFLAFFSFRLSCSIGLSCALRARYQAGLSERCAQLRVSRGARYVGTPIRAYECASMSRLHNDCALRSALASAHIMQFMIHDTCVIHVAPHTSPAPAQRSSPALAPIYLSICQPASPRRPCRGRFGTLFSCIILFFGAISLHHHITIPSAHQPTVSQHTTVSYRIDTALALEHGHRIRYQRNTVSVAVLVDVCARVAPPRLLEVATFHMHRGGMGMGSELCTATVTKMHCVRG